MASHSFPATMIAYRFQPSKGEPVKEGLPIPEIASDEVLVKILAAGVCHSDVGILDTSAPMHNAFKDSFTLGHEGAGERTKIININLQLG